MGESPNAAGIGKFNCRIHPFIKLLASSMLRSSGLLGMPKPNGGVADTLDAYTENGLAPGGKAAPASAVGRSDDDDDDDDDDDAAAADDDDVTTKAE